MGAAALISRGHGRNVPAVALIVSMKPERLAQEWVCDLGLDGLCCAAAAEMLSTCGWPNAMALSIGRAMAMKARSDLISLLAKRANDHWGQAASWSTATATANQ
jgi:hypothetical protein